MKRRCFLFCTRLFDTNFMKDKQDENVGVFWCKFLSSRTHCLLIKTRVLDAAFVGPCCFVKVMLTLLRKYPLTRTEAGQPGTISMATPEDEEECAMDFDPKASTQVLFVF